MKCAEAFISFGLGFFFGHTAAPLLVSIAKLDASVALNNVTKLKVFGSSCGLYHYMEFMYKLEYHFQDLSWHDFQIDHSLAYVVAMCLCLLEYGSKQLAIYYTVGKPDTEFAWYQNAAHAID